MAEVAEVAEVAMVAAEVAMVAMVAVVAMVAMVAVVRGNNRILHCSQGSLHSRNRIHRSSRSLHSIQTVRAHASLRACPKSRPACQRCPGSQR